MAGVFQVLTQALVERNILFDIGLCIVASTVLASLCRILNQPLLLGYIAAGIVIGPPALGWVSDKDSIARISELGLAFLMFIVGMEIDVKKMLQSAKVVGVATVVQVAVCSGIGWAVALALVKFGIVPGDDKGMHALYLGVCTSFSSTMIAVKVLSDKGELDTLAGRIGVGISLFQDVLAIVVLALQPNMANPELGLMAMAAVKGIGLAVGATIVSRYLLPIVFRGAAKSPEILFILAVSWCFVVCYAAIASGFSSAMGALIAGVAIAAFPYSHDVVAKMRSLRDFFVTLFFVALGMQIQISSFSTVAAALILSALILVNRFLPVVPTLALLGYRKRIGILSSIALTPMSEFGLVIAGIGLAGPLFHVSQEIVSIVAMCLVITCTAATYLIAAGPAIADRLAKEHGPGESAEAPSSGSHEPYPIVLIGTHRTASALIPLLQEEGKRFCLIDFSPDVHRRAKENGVPIVYGDISHMDTLERAGVPSAKLLISSISDDFLRGTDNLKLLKLLRRLNPGARIVVTAESADKALELYRAGADYVLLPRRAAARSVADVIVRLEAGEGEDLRHPEIEALKRSAELVD